MALLSLVLSILGLALGNLGATLLGAMLAAGTVFAVAVLLT